jgi:2-iminobutanoate/2-iminopropanoate deaminase
MAIKREKIQPKGIHIRMMAGQPAYTQIVTVSGTGRQIFVAGQLARDADGNCVGKGDMRAQIQQVGENIKACLEAAGATLADIVKTNTYVTDFEEFSKHGDMRMRYFGPAADQHDGRDPPPRRSRFHDRDRGDRLRRLIADRPTKSAGLRLEPGIDQFLEAAGIVNRVVAELLQRLATQCGAAAGATVDQDNLAILKRRIVERALRIGPKFHHTT